MMDGIQETQRKNLKGQISIFDISVNVEKTKRDEDIYPDIK